jgi:hypothetical protein
MPDITENSIFVIRLELNLSKDCSGNIISEPNGQSVYEHNTGGGNNFGKEEYKKDN